MPFLVIVGFLVYLPLRYLVKKIVKIYEIKNKHVLKFIQDKDFRVIIIRFLLEGCIDISMSVSIALIFVSIPFNLTPTI